MFTLRYRQRLASRFIIAQRHAAALAQAFIGNFHASGRVMLLHCPAIGLFIGCVKQGAINGGHYYQVHFMLHVVTG